jgi:hypothetical protein
MNAHSELRVFGELVAIFEHGRGLTAEEIDALVAQWKANGKKPVPMAHATHILAEMNPVADVK